MFTDPNRQGDWAELKAVAWLWEQGYEVFRNLGSSGSVDLIATKGEVTLKIDVKTIRTTNRGWVFRAPDHEARLAAGIVFLWVSHDGQVGWNRDYFIPRKRHGLSNNPSTRTDS